MILIIAWNMWLHSCVICRNRASGGAPSSSSSTRKATSGLPKIASSTTRPRSHSGSVVTGLTRGMLPSGRTSTVAAAAGQTNLRRQRRTSSGAEGQT
jgi:GATA-binding protein